MAAVFGQQRGMEKCPDQGQIPTLPGRVTLWRLLAFSVLHVDMMIAPTSLRITRTKSAHGRLEQGLAESRP